MSDVKYPQHLVFGLDIGTRSIVGTVGYKERDKFYVVAQCVKEHETRAMMDGQIHDITKVGETITLVKYHLEEIIGRELKEVCIAAAGRVLETVTAHVKFEFQEETAVTPEHIHSLDLIGLEDAHNKMSEANETDLKFFCVGYSIIKYYMNDYPVSNLEGHKASAIEEDIIATFLPEQVVDGLYAAVAIADLEVANLTLEPIAAISVAIPDKYRLLNMALVDVGAGTSDISITKDGSIIAYGMIPAAGDKLTEIIVKQYLVDFKTAESIKKLAGTQERVAFQDIMGLRHEVDASEIQELVKPMLNEIADQVSEKIKELNGSKAVSAVFVVGGGGKFKGFTDSLAKGLGIMEERVALRGEEVMEEIEFIQQDVMKDSLLVTPVGICLSFYDQKNNFIFVNFNGERVKLYDNNRLSVVDAAIQYGFDNEGLFPKRGKALNFSVNGKQRIIRGQLGETAIVTVNGESAGINTPIKANDKIRIIQSTAGADADYIISQLEESTGNITILANNNKIKLPKSVEVNGALVTYYYSIQDEDDIRVLNYYTVRQVLEFMDVLISDEAEITVNHVTADKDERVYDNFSVEWTDHLSAAKNSETIAEDEIKPDIPIEVKLEEDQGVKDIREKLQFALREKNSDPDELGVVKEEMVPKLEIQDLNVIVNNRTVTLSGKTSYVFVDIFDVIDFDLNTSGGRSIVTKINGKPAQYMQPLSRGDQMEIYWKDGLEVE